MDSIEQIFDRVKINVMTTDDEYVIATCYTNIP